MLPGRRLLLNSCAKEGRVPSTHAHQAKEVPLARWSGGSRQRRGRRPCCGTCAWGSLCHWRAGRPIPEGSWSAARRRMHISERSAGDTPRCPAVRAYEVTCAFRSPRCRARPDGPEASPGCRPAVTADGAALRRPVSSCLGNAEIHTEKDSSACDSS